MLTSCLHFILSLESITFSSFPPLFLFINCPQTQHNRPRWLKRRIFYRQSSEAVGVNSFAREVSPIDFRQTKRVPADKPAAVGTQFKDPYSEPVNLVSIRCWTCWADLRATYPQAACRHTGNFNRLFPTLLRSFHPCELTTRLMSDLTGSICVTVKITF